MVARNRNSQARMLLLAGVFLVFGGGGAGFAQAPDDPSLDLRISPSVAPLDPERAREEAILTGRDDVVLLDRRKFFTLNGALGGGYTTNAALSETDRRSDTYGVANISLRTETKIANHVDVHAEIGLSATRYEEFGGLDYSAFVSSFGAHVQWRRIDFDAAYTPIVVYDRALSERQLTQHRFVASAGRTFSLPRSVALRVSISAERINADPDPFSNSAVSASAAVGAPISRRRNIQAFASVRGVARNYDNYFEGLVGVPREDRLLEGAVGASWTPRPNVALEARWTQSRNRSTSDVNRYRAGNGGVSLGAVIRF